MAKLERTIRGNPDEILRIIDHELLEGSISATYEDGSDYTANGVRCSVRVYERYSYAGGNRVSMNITLFGRNDLWHLCAITAGGSRATFFKIDTWGEEAFLEKLEDIVNRF